MTQPQGSSSLADEGRLALLVRDGKVAALSARRLLDWRRRPAAYPAPVLCTAQGAFAHLLGERRVPIRRSDNAAHPILEAGKRQNLAVAAPSFDGLLLSPERPLSFWRTLGPATRARGFTAGMELRGGCIVPALGGGLCLLSNALFALCASLGFRILERHGHTMEAVPPLPGEPFGLDATVFYPYVDLRVAPATGTTWLRASVVGDILLLRIFGTKEPNICVQLEDEEVRTEGAGALRYRTGRLRRRIFARADGALVSDEIIATGRRRILHTEEQRRSCLSCDCESYAPEVALAAARGVPLIATRRGAGATNSYREVRVLDGEDLARALG